MRLLELTVQARARVVEIEGGQHLYAKLTQLGLHTGDCLQLLRRAPFGGPLLIVCNGREIALGRGVAEKIIVELESCE